jgi:hypothetical protein
MFSTYPRGLSIFDIVSETNYSHQLPLCICDDAEF